MAIPKKGNLSPQGNYSTIQMLSSISALYERIISIRFPRWCKVYILYYNRNCHVTISIVIFNLEKALLFLKKLISHCIGNFMLHRFACIVCLVGCSSNEEFPKNFGIREGVPIASTSFHSFFG